MPCEAGAENRGIAVGACVDAEVDGRPAFHINHHPEFDHPQSKALDIGQKLGRRGSSESVAMALKTTDEARHAADGIC